jgi:two-component system, sensor histidine kinase
MSTDRSPDWTGENGSTVLILDDDEDNAEMLVELARQQGYRALRAQHGVEALLMLEEERADVVVLDIVMPDIDGFELAGMMRSRWGRSLRIIALTGFLGPNVQERARVAGFDALLVKPIHVDRFLSVLKEHARDGSS